SRSALSLVSAPLPTATLFPYTTLFRSWSKEDMAHFEAAGKKLAEQYDAYEPLPGLHINGEQTLGENIADLAGLEVAYQAYINSRSEEHTSELQSREKLVCRLLLEKKKV